MFNKDPMCFLCKFSADIIKGTISRKRKNKKAILLLSQTYEVLSFAPMDFIQIALSRLPLNINSSVLI